MVKGVIKVILAIFLYIFLGACEKRYYGSVKVNSNPPGAEIYIDGAFTGEITPHYFDGIPAGTHELKLRKEGYEDYSNYFTLRYGEILDFEITLSPGDRFYTLLGRYRYNHGLCIVRGKEDNFIIGGRAMTSSDSYDMYIIKMNSLGEVIWDSIYGGDGWDEVYSIGVEEQGYILVGRTYSYITGYGDYGNGYIVKIDDNGKLLEERRIRGRSGEYLMEYVKRGGRYIFAGGTNTKGHGRWDFYLVMMDEELNLENELMYGGKNDDRCYSLVYDSSTGGYILVGESRSFSESHDWDVYVVKVDREGDLIWERTFGFPDSDEKGVSCIEISPGRFIISGESVDGEKERVYTLMIDGEGNKIWENTCSYGEKDRVNKIYMSSWGDIYIVGSSYHEDWRRWDLHLWAIDPEGKFLWDKEYNEKYDEFGYSLTEIGGGGLLLVGTLFKEDSSYIYLIKEKVYDRDNLLYYTLDSF